MQFGGSNLWQVNINESIQKLTLNNQHIHIRKRWILFPPHENLSSTRVPYEESSIYSKLNFFSPYNIGIFKSMTIQDAVEYIFNNIFVDIKQAKSIVLQPGEVLFVPNGWWHYVENLEMAISINIWIPLVRNMQHYRFCRQMALNLMLNRPGIVTCNCSFFTTGNYYILAFLFLSILLVLLYLHLCILIIFPIFFHLL